MTQLTINFDPRAHARRSHPDTSRMAAEEVAPKIPEQCAEVLSELRRYIAERGELPTGQELAEFMVTEQFDKRSMCARRLPDLRKAGYIESCDPRRCRMSGRMAQTWRAK